VNDDGSSLLRLKVWRPSRRDKEYMATDNEGPVELASLDECLYTWESSEDLFGSVIDQDQTERIREVLMTTFRPDKPIEERGVNRLDAVVRVMDEILVDNGYDRRGSWLTSGHVGRSPAGEEVNLRQQGLLALRQHIQWVHDTFVHVPDAHVTLR